MKPTAVEKVAVDEKAKSHRTTTSYTTKKITVSFPTTSTTSTTTSSTSSTSEVALVDIPLTFYHPEEEMTKTSESNTLATHTKSLVSRTDS